MEQKETDFLALKVGLTIFIVFMIPLADTAWWINILIGMIQGVGVYTVLAEVFKWYQANKYEKK